MIISTMISVAANMLVATNGVIGCAVAGWPPIALLLAIKLLLGLLEDYQDQQQSVVEAEVVEDSSSESGERRRSSAGPGDGMLPATPAAQFRWLRIWESICSEGGSDREVADRMGVSERQVRLVRAAGVAAVSLHWTVRCNQVMGIDVSWPRAVQAPEHGQARNDRDEDWPA